MVRGGTFVQLTTFILILGLGDVGADPCRGFTTDGWTPGGGGGGGGPTPGAGAGFTVADYKRSKKIYIIRLFLQVNFPFNKKER